MAHVNDILAQGTSKLPVTSLEVMFRLMHSYHESHGFARMGEWVQDRVNGMRFVAVGHARDLLKGQDHANLLVALSEDAAFHLTTSRLVKLRAPRLSLHEMLRYVADRIDRPDVTLPGLLILGAHFKGLNGARYADEAAHLWCVHALIELAGNGMQSSRAELNGLIQKSRLPAASLPPVITAESAADGERANIAAMNAHASPAVIGLAQHVVEIGRASIDRARDDADARPRFDTLAGHIALSPLTGQRFLLTGTSSLREGMADVIDMDTLASACVSLATEELSEDRVDAGWFWEVVRDSVLYGVQPDSAIAWLAYSLDGPGGTPDESPARVFIAALACLAQARYTAAITPLQSRRLLKRARELRKHVDKADLGKLYGIAPELRAVDTPMRTTPAAAEEAHHALQAALHAYDQQQAQPKPAAASLPAVTPPSPPKPAKVEFAKPAQPLRFNVSERQCLAMDWQLVHGSDSHERAVTAAMAWLEAQLGTTLPANWRDGSHEIERAGVVLSIEASDRLFAFRLEHPDTEIPTRWWRLEGTVQAGHEGRHGLACVRHQSRDLVELPAPSPAVPGIVTAWAKSPGLMVAGAPTGRVLRVASGADLNRLQNILSRSAREAAVWAVAGDAAALPESLAGLGRVVRVESAALDAYAAQLAALEPDTLHLYAPGRQRPEVISIAGEDWIDALRLRSIDAHVPTKAPTFREMREAIRQSRLLAITLAEQLQGPSEPHASHASITDSAAAEQRAPSDLEQLLEVAEGERDQAIAELESAESEIARLRAHVEALTVAVQSRGIAIGSLDPSVEPVPETLEGLPDWSESIAPRVVFTDKALRTAAKTPHNEVPKIYAALQALHDLYWPMKFGLAADRAATHAKWREFLAQNRMTFSGVGTAPQNLRYEDEYRGVLDGVTYTATMHVAGSSAHDPLRCLRIYVDVDEANQRIVVLHLPTHLTNSLS